MALLVRGLEPAERARVRRRATERVARPQVGLHAHQLSIASAPLASPISLATGWPDTRPPETDRIDGPVNPRFGAAGRIIEGLGTSPPLRPPYRSAGMTLAGPPWPRDTSDVPCLRWTETRPPCGLRRIEVGHRRGAAAHAGPAAAASGGTCVNARASSSRTGGDRSRRRRCGARDQRVPARPRRAPRPRHGLLGLAASILLRSASGGCDEA